MEIELMRLAEISRFKINPKSHKVDRIAESFGRFGFVSPLLVDETTGSLVAGHGRLDALEAGESAGAEPPDGIEIDDAGHWLVPVIRGVSFEDEDEALAYLLADNRLSEVGAWDDDALRNVLSDFADRNMIDGTGWTNDEIDDYLDRLSNDPAAGTGTGGRDPLPGGLPDTGVAGAGEANGRFILVYSDEVEKAEICSRLGIDGTGVVYSVGDFGSEVS